MPRSWAVFADLGWKPGFGPCLSRYPMRSHLNTTAHMPPMIPTTSHRFWRILLQVDRIFAGFRGQFLGKVSPVHFFWGSFDIAVTRFSGRAGPLLTSKSPNLGAWVMQEAYSHEVSSVGFWPGNGGFGEAAFYSYAYPEPAGFASAPMSPNATYYDQTLGQFILPYDAVRQAKSPDDYLMGYLVSTYEAAANLGRWDRAALERPGGQ